MGLISLIIAAVLIALFALFIFAKNPSIPAQDYQKLPTQAQDAANAAAQRGKIDQDQIKKLDSN